MASNLNASEDLYAVADFCLIPIGTGDPSIAEYIAECQRVLQRTNLTFKARVYGHGTNIEGLWSDVAQAIQDCHRAVHAKGAPRVSTDIRIGTRVDREILLGEGNIRKVERVESILSNENQEKEMGL